MAGQTATHCVVFARLLIDGKDYGVHQFLVPIRDRETGQPLPGVEVGDCGAKMGRNGLDNGWLRFNQVRIPRDWMLQRWAQVSADGQYHQPPKLQLSYGALTTGRVSIVGDCAETLKKALTIAVRYSAIRRQFPSDTQPEIEQQILDYQTHQARSVLISLFLS
jgi:acyl-CoA oxidase